MLPRTPYGRWLTNRVALQPLPSTQYSVSSIELHMLYVVAAALEKVFSFSLYPPEIIEIQLQTGSPIP